TPWLEFPGPMAERAAWTGAQVCHVVRRCSCLLCGVGQDAEIARRRQAALIGVEYVEPGQHVTVQGLYPNLDLAVVAEGRAVPAAPGPVAACDRIGTVSQTRADVTILGGGPGGYEAALVAAQLGAQVTVVEADGLGGACVLTDCVPSKTLIATSETMGILGGSGGLGIRIEGYDGRMRPRPGAPAGPVTVDAARLNGRVKALAVAQSADVAGRLAAEGVD